MSNNHPQDEQRGIHDPGAIILPDAAETARREEAEKSRRQQERDELILELQRRQTAAQSLQAKSNWVIAGLTLALVVTGIIGGFISFLQFQAAKDSSVAAKISADAAQSAATTASETLTACV